MVGINEAFDNLLNLNGNKIVNTDLRTKYKLLSFSKNKSDGLAVAKSVYDFVTDPDTQDFLLSQPEKNLEKLRQNIFDLAWRMGDTNHEAFEKLCDAANVVLKVKVVKSAQEYLKNL